MPLLISSKDASSYSAPPLNYHVFLSFRGQETRNGFTDHLYAALRQRGIVTFKDDRELEKGETISEQLMEAIEGSLFAVVVFSQGYAFSSWCLDELQYIVESRKDLGQTVFPVFYGVNPSDVRRQKGEIARAFDEYEKEYSENKEKVQRWRISLADFANLVGWDTWNRSEACIVEDIVEAIWTKLAVKLPSDFDYLVGIQSKVDKLISLLKMELDHKCFVGIWGMGGIGKTTLARVVYEIIQSKFEASCFIANVKKESERNGLVYLQKTLLSRLLQRKIEITDTYEGVKAIRHFLCHKKVLIVLDHVSHVCQLKNLVGNKEWFGAGSKIIVTTRDIHLLRAHEHFKEYEIEMLNFYESLELLYQKTFKSALEARYWSLSKEVIKYAGGLPLALEVLGQFLCRRSESEWRDTLDKMKQNLHKDILETLRISYDDLEDEEYKTIFLDIACFFNWEEKVEVIQILESRGLHPTIGIEVLIEKSLLCYSKSPYNSSTLESEKEFLYMHDLLQEMGKNIVLQESPHDISRRSRLWSLKDIDPVLKLNKGTKKIQSIVLKLHQPYDANWHPDCFSKMRNLKLLYLSNVHLSHRLNSLPNALEVFIWDKYALEALPPIDQLYELVHLQLPFSKIKLFGNGPTILDRLKVIDLSHSRDLIKMSDFSGTPNLESLLLEGCISLVTLHESLGKLRRLVKLNLKGCKSLIVLPSKLEMNSLKEFILSGCSKLEKLPAFGTNMKSLSIFDVSETNIKEVPSSLVHLTNLKQLSLRGCIGLASNSHSLPAFSGLSGLHMLRKLDLSFCNMNDGLIPNDLSGLSSLFKLDLSGNNFINLPTACISNLLNLERLNLNGCPRLRAMPQLPPNLYMVDAKGCSSMEPISDLQHLFASLISKHRNLLAHEVVCLCIPGYEIPTWFEHRKYHDSIGCVSLTVNIPYIKNKTEWTGIAVCLAIHTLSFKHSPSEYFTIHWEFKAPDDDYHALCLRRVCVFEKERHGPHLYIAFFPFNTQNCWQHLQGEHRQLELQIEAHRFWKIKEHGWRLICKKDFDVCSTSTATASSVQIRELGNDQPCGNEFVRECPASTSFYEKSNHVLQNVGKELKSCIHMLPAAKW